MPAVTFFVRLHNYLQEGLLGFSSHSCDSGHLDLSEVYGHALHADQKYRVTVGRYAASGMNSADRSLTDLIFGCLKILNQHMFS
ncbi:hypothetical protein FRX31_025257 [Thalictrum thalictroides]|uniref:Uncharacterized protein n=1 Tax=Thalictrum thalictroides TaxID=46969 RepID=A0A7J6VLZ3_THATH|nr:hypothetical protein FRX31_025257 [Thalictrum thalictroides]